MSVEQFPELSFGNRSAISADTECGCYMCLCVVNGNAITEWTDNGQTAICPLCGVDSLLPGITDFDLLSSGLERWFSRAADADFGA